MTTVAQAYVQIVPSARGFGRALDGQIGPDLDAVMAATDAYHAASDAIARFLDQWDRWTSWATDDGAEPVSKRAFGEALDKRGYPVHRGTGGRRVRRGLGTAGRRRGPTRRPTSGSSDVSDVTSCSSYARTHERTYRRPVTCVTRGGQ